MTFAYPRMLLLLAIAAPLLSLFLWWSWRKRQQLIGQFVQSRLLANLTVGVSRFAQKTRMALLLFAVVLLFAALARPQWGFAWEEASQHGLDIIVAIDTSRSMLAEDVSPDRLQRAKLAALDLMRAASNDRLGLVAFAGTAFLQCPLTHDDEAFRLSLAQINVGIIPQGGTALSEAIRTAAAAFKGEADNHKILVLFTDGEDHEHGAVEEAQRAASAGMRIFTVGVGTPEGELLSQRDERGVQSYIKDQQGNVIKSRLNEGLLGQIAEAGNGFYMHLRGPHTIEALYQRGLAPLPGSETATRRVRQHKERFQWPLALAILLLMVEVFVPDRKRVQRTEAIRSASNPGLKRIAAILAFGLFLSPACASPSSALRNYESGLFQTAHEQYLRLLEKKPGDVRLQYNAGAAAYQARKFEESASHFAGASLTPDVAMQQRAFYNLGNALYRWGEQETDPALQAQRWQQAAQQYETALKLEPKDADAQFNLDFVRQKLEELKQQQQQSSDQDQSGDEENQDKQQNEQDQEQPNDQTDSDESQGDDQDQTQNESQQQTPGQQDQDNQQQEDSSSPADPEQEERSDGNAQPQPDQPSPGQMTPEQAARLLDSQKDQERVFLYLPPEQREQRQRVFRDW
jgi:Ca-activated chloride channel homolog